MHLKTIVMYLNNLTGKPVKDISFEGYMFTIPAGVSLCWDKFGTFILNLYKPAGEGAGIPPVIAATAKQWKGDRYVDVRRFALNASHIPKRADLLKIAKERGIEASQLEQWKEDETIPNDEIARAINELEVPDAIKYPEATPDASADNTAEKTADDLLNSDGKGVKSDAADTKVPAADTTTSPSNTAAPGGSQTVTPPVNTPAPKTGGTGAKKKATAGKAAAAKKMPRTPKPSK